MNYSEPEIAVLKKYRILDRNGAPTMVNLIRPLTAGGPPPGHGPMVAPDVIKKLLAADTTPDKRWLDWIFFQAGSFLSAPQEFSFFCFLDSRYSINLSLAISSKTSVA